MKRTLLTAILLLSSLLCFAQQNNTEKTNDDFVPYKLLEQKPSFIGGNINDFSKWVNSNLRYPAVAKKNRVQGRVNVQFTINADGDVTDVQVLNSVDESLAEEAVRVISKSPKWKPGIYNGKPASVRIEKFPVIFQLR